MLLGVTKGGGAVLLELLQPNGSLVLLGLQLLQFGAVLGIYLGQPLGQFHVEL